MLGKRFHATIEPLALSGCGISTSVQSGRRESASIVARATLFSAVGWGYALGASWALAHNGPLNDQSANRCKLPHHVANSYNSIRRAAVQGGCFFLSRLSKVACSGACADEWHIDR
jgi:hypothetical protein